MHGFFFYESKGNEYFRFEKSFNPLPYIYKPEDIIKIGQGFKIDKQIVSKPHSEENQELWNYCVWVFKNRLERGVITSSDAIWIARYILKKNIDICKALAHRFPYIIVDEAQDTSDLQFEIFNMLKSNNLSNLEYIGDLNQTIYEWRDADPSQLKAFSQDPDWNLLHFTENRRSVQRIINFYSRLKPSNTPNIKSSVNNDMNLKIRFIRYEEKNDRAVINDFIKLCDAKSLKSSLILTRANNDVKKLSGISDPVNVWKSPLPDKIIRTKLSFQKNDMINAIRIMKWVVADIVFKDVTKKKNFIESKKDDYKFNSNLIRLISQIPSLDLSVKEWDTQCRQLLMRVLNQRDMDFVIKQKIAGHKMIDLLSETVNSHYSVDNNEIIVQTIHSVKGASVDAVLLFLNDKKSAQSISIKDIPELDNSLIEVTEKQRLIFVACSRAKQYLSIAVPSSVTEKYLLKRFRGLEIEVDSKFADKTLF